jgi:hypothetical protein
VKGLSVVLVACAAAAAACALAPGVAAARSCGGSVTVGAGEIVLTATSINVFAGVTCSRGRQVVRAYFRRQLHDLEGCAGPAKNPPFDGCRVFGYTCRSLGTRTSKARCDGPGGRVVRFRERDIDKS